MELFKFMSAYARHAFIFFDGWTRLLDIEYWSYINLTPWNFMMTSDCNRFDLFHDLFIPFFLAFNFVKIFISRCFSFASLNNNKMTISLLNRFSKSSFFRNSFLSMLISIISWLYYIKQIISSNSRKITHFLENQSYSVILIVITNFMLYRFQSS